MRVRRLIGTVAVAASVGLSGWAATAQQATTWSNVGPIFAENCIRCHGSSHPTGLDLRSYASVLAGSNRGAVVIAGDPDNSLLVRKIRGQSGARMPRNSPALSAADIATIVAWVTGGMQQ